jgi:ketosteroid isomerase-like protein
MSAAEDNIKLVEQFWQLFGENRVAEAMNLFADDATWWINGSTPMSGYTPKSQFVEWGKKLIPNMWPKGLKVSMKRVWAIDDMVIAESESIGIHGSGNEYRGQYAHFFKIAGGKVAWVKEYADTQLAQTMLTEWSVVDKE